MFTRLPLVVLALAAALTAPGASRADVPENGAACFLERHNITVVKPYYEIRRLGRAQSLRLLGAEVRLAPQLNLTTEWVQEGVHEQLAAARKTGTRGCLEDVRRVDISVDPNGDGMLVRLLAKDPSKAQQVVRRAHALVGE